MRPPTDQERICALPRHVHDDTDMSPYFVKPGAMFGDKPARLLPVQSLMVREAATMNGLLGFVGVGHGKTLASLCIMYMMHKLHGVPYHKMVLFIPTQVRADFYKQYQAYAKAFHLPHGFQVRTYHELSQHTATAYLDNLRPEVIICDEADALSDFKATRTQRFLRYIKKNSIWFGGACRLFIMSGTMMRKSIKDWQHLAKFALGPNSPAPIEHGSLELFCEAIDNENGNQDNLQQLMDAFGADTPREAFRRRLLSTAGVVVTEGGSAEVPVEIHLRYVDTPKVVLDALHKLLGWWELPSGEILSSALEVHAKSMELSMGFYHVFVWPEGRVDTDWLEARQAWHRALRACLPNAPAGYDSPKLVGDACERALFEEQNEVALSAKKRDPYLTADTRTAYSQWREQKHKAPPPTKTVWLDRFLVWDTLQWLSGQPPTLIWSETPDMSNELAAYAGSMNVELVNVGVGTEAAAWLAAGGAPVHTVVSQNSHYRGLNLQRWHHNLILTPPSGGQIVEQLIGRTARQGQKNKVSVYVNVHTAPAQDAWESCKYDARLAEETCGVRQTLNHAEQHDPVPLATLPPRYPGGAMVPPGWRRGA